MIITIDGKEVQVTEFYDGWKPLEIYVEGLTDKECEEFLETYYDEISQECIVDVCARAYDRAKDRMKDGD